MGGVRKRWNWGEKGERIHGGVWGGWGFWVLGGFGWFGGDVEGVTKMVTRDSWCFVYRGV